MPRALTALPPSPEWAAALAAAYLAAAYLGARLLAAVAGRLSAGAARRTGGALDAHLAQAMARRLTYALFVAGASVPLGELPLPGAWPARLGGALFVAGALLFTAAAWCAWALLMTWYTDPRRPGAAEGPAHEFGPLFGKVGRVALVLFATLVLLEHFHVNVGSLVISLGVGSLAVGLAAQDTLANMVAGFTLLLDRPFRIGDRVELAGGEVGDVETIGIRATRIRTLDETLLVVPNSVLVKERLVNRSRPTRHITCRIETGVAYGTDLAHAKEVLREAALASPYVDGQRPVVVLVTHFADAAVTLRLIFQARDYLEQGLAVSAVHEEIYRRLEAAGIVIPYPVHRIVGLPPVPAPGRTGQV